MVVLDNGHFGETGMQRSHTSLGTRLVDVAKACGIHRSKEVFQMTDIRQLAMDINAMKGLMFAQVHIRQEDLPRQLPTRDGTFLKNRMRQNLGLPLV